MAKHLHFDCFSGVAGDMALAALVDVGAPFERVRAALESLGLPGFIELEKTKRKGIAASRIVVHAEVEHKHRHLHHIDKIIDAGAIDDREKAIAKQIFRTLAEAEAAVHGTTIEKVHFHEVGAVDSIFDIVGVAVALAHLSPDRITSSPVPTGKGWVDCDHGRMPIPAPATARLLLGVPIASDSVEGELTTPTGAAILRTIVHEFTSQLPQLNSAIGCGAGTKDFADRANVLRVFWSDGAPQLRADSHCDIVARLETDIDDATGERLGLAVERLLEAGALDVRMSATQMKKNRPGVTVTVLCQPERTHEFETMMFQETKTFGIRRDTLTRSKLARRAVAARTEFGRVACKLGWNDFVKVAKPEFEDCAQIARERQVAYDEVRRAAERALEEGQFEEIDDGNAA